MKHTQANEATCIHDTHMLFIYIGPTMYPTLDNKHHLHTKHISMNTHQTKSNSESEQHVCRPQHVTSVAMTAAAGLSIPPCMHGTKLHCNDCTILSLHVYCCTVLFWIE